jgi:hypothetical protein
MDNERIKKLVEKTQLRTRLRDVPLVRALIESAESVSKAIPHIPLDDYTAPIIFESLYRAIRQIGDGFWWLQGYEPRTHDVSIELLIDKEQGLAQKIERLKQLRHDSAYRGSKITIENAKEIILFWDEHCSKLLEDLRKEAV